MSKILTSLITIPLILAFIQGCAPVSSIVPEKNFPIEEKYHQPKKIKNNRIMLVRSEYPQVCDCFQISKKIYETYEDLADLKEIEESSLEELKKDPSNLLERTYLTNSRKLQKLVNETKDILINEGQNCSCYGREL